MPKEHKSNFDISGEAIRQLAALLTETGLTDIEVAEGDRRIRVSRSGGVVPQAVAPAAVAAPVVVDTAPAPKPAGSVIASPMVGTAYLAPEPSAPPFVLVGSKVKAGDTLLIIEAMKVMNPIKATKSGTVVEILVTDTKPVEFGETLMVIE